jgi:hypothetical protein
MRNGSCISTTYRADKLLSIHPIADEKVKATDFSSTARRVIKKSHHKKQRSWDKKLIRDSFMSLG